MAHIEAISPDVADGELAEAYRSVASARGGVANILQVQSLNPRAMSTHLALYRTIMFASSPLSRTEREAVAVAVSATNQCAYCVEHHGRSLRRLAKDDALVDALSSDPAIAPLEPRLRAMVDFAIALTRSPGDASAERIEVLRATGLDDRAILDLCQVVAYFNFVNRMAMGLGVELERDAELDVTTR